MEPSKTILWLDNDPGYIKPFILALEEEGFLVTVATTVSQAEKLLTGGGRFSLIIIDVMIPTVSDVEEERYRPEETEYGHKTGLVFYKRMKQMFAERDIEVIVLTVRLDRSIASQFQEAGLPASRFLTKMELRETPLFVLKIKTILS